MLISKSIILLLLNLVTVNTPETWFTIQSSTLASPEEQNLANSQDELDILVLEEMKDLVRSHYETRMQNIEKVQRGEYPDIDSGLWYANQYFELLEQSVHLDSRYGTRLKRFKSANHFFKGYASPNSLLIQKEGFFNYHLKRGTLPSEVIAGLGNALIFIDCAIIFDIAFYRVALKFLGKEQFDAHFGKNDGRAMFSAEGHAKKIDGLLSTKTGSLKTPGGVGSFFYKFNHAAYSLKEKNGESQGFNLIVSGKNTDGETLFVGLGLKPEGVTEADVEDVLVSEFNRKPFNQRIVTDSTWKADGPGGDYLLIMELLETETITSIHDQSPWEHLAHHYSSLKGIPVSAEQMRDALSPGVPVSTFQPRFLDLKKLLALKKL